MKGIAAWLVWRENGFRHARVALMLFLIQLAANALWTWLFFAWQLGALAFIENIILIGLIVATAIAFWRVHIFAGVLMLPYLAWIKFAVALTYATLQRNPQVPG
jgi:benzodiazapine receptor